MTQTSSVSDAAAYCSSEDTQYTSGAPLACLAGVPIFLPCNGLGSLTVNYKMPQIWVPASSGFVPEGANYSYLLRVSFVAVNNAAVANLLSIAIFASGFPILADNRNMRNTATAQEICLSLPVGVPAGVALGQVRFTPENAVSIYNIRMAAFRLGR